MPLRLLGLLIAIAGSSLAQTHVPKSPANRLLHLNDPSPFYPHKDFPKLITPQWVGEKGVEAVVTLGIDDMRDAPRYEKFLRPILERLKKIDGRAPISILTNRIQPEDQQVQTWLKEGLSIEVHTLTHPCPLLHKGNFQQAFNVVQGGVDLLSQIKGNKPVAYRMPCCDSMNSLSPRFFAEIFNKTSNDGRYLLIDSSVFNITTSKDKSLPREWVLDKDGKERFFKYLPRKAARPGMRTMGSYVGTIEDYPYPYVINRLCWEFPCTVPSDWEAQNLLGNQSPQMLEDWKRALDVTVQKQGVMNLVFHPHGWSSSAQLVDLVDYAEKTYGKKVKFLNFRECADRLEKHLLQGGSLRNAKGRDAGVRILDANNDGFMDVLIPAKKLARIWDAEGGAWIEAPLPFDPQGLAAGILDKSNTASFNDPSGTVWSFRDKIWLKSSITPASDRTGILRDVDNDGIAEWIGKRIHKWDAAKERWTPQTHVVPANLHLADPSILFVDLNADGFEDILFSNKTRWGIYLWETRVNPGLGWRPGWSYVVAEGLREDPDALPMISRGGENPNNGAWIHSNHIWWQNEFTANLPDVVDRRSFNQLLDFGGPKAKEPAESKKCFRVRKGFEVQLVASEPQIQDPVAFAWGTDGKLWVAEMGDYPSGINGKPGGVVRWLEDTDGNGHYEKSTVFLDGLNFPNGVLAWGNGVLISAAPDILYAEDTTGNGKADIRRVLFTGFREGNQQHRMNGFALGLDNWIYAANGDSGGMITSKATDKRVNINGLDFRFKVTGEFEPVAGQTQFGRWRDDWGNWFGNNNPNWVWHYHVPIRYFARNPHLATPGMRRNVFSNNRLFPVSPRMERPNTPGAYGRVTSACSAQPYRGGLFGKDFASSVFISEPVHNLVHREVLIPEGISFRGQRAKDEADHEFLASTDNWFRPTQLQTGPDGALYIADMYRLIIEHPEWIPAAMQSRVDLRAGHDRGRIWKVFPKEAKLRPFPHLDKLNGEQLAYALDSPNGWQRDQAQRLLLERKDPKTHQILAFMATSQVNAKISPQTRIHALHTLAGLDALKDEMLKVALRDNHPAVREHAVRLCEGGREALARRCLDDKDPRVLRQLSFTLGEGKGPLITEALVQLAVQHRDNADIQLAVKSSSATHAVAMLKQIFSQKSRPSADLSNHLLQLVTTGGQQEALATVLNELTSVKQVTAGELTILAGLLDALAARGQSLTTFRAKAVPALQTALDKTDKLFANARANPARIESIALLGRGLKDQAADRQALHTLLQATQPPSIQQAALSTLRALNAPDLSAELLASWRTYSPTMRATVIDTLLSSELSTTTLLNALEKNTLPAGQISAAHQLLLTTHKQLALRMRAAKLLGRSNPDRAKVIARYADVAKLQPNPERGAALFKTTCSACHQFKGAGNPVGPDLATLSGKPLGHWLTAILDPNAALEDKFISYIATLKNSTAHVGVITTETPTSLTLRTATGQPHTLLRRDLKSLESTNLSLMPNGLEATLPPQSMADLLGYLRGVRLCSVGVAKTNVTPKHPVVLAGYGGRRTEHEGIDTKLWARAMVIGSEKPVAVVALDNCGVPAAITEQLAKRLAKHGITRERLVVAATHTHNAPNLTGYAPVLWAGRMNETQKKNQAAYTAFTIDKMEAAVVAALKARQSMELDWAQGRVGFGGNRRVLKNGKWAGFGFQRSGPVDHSLPVLFARDVDGRVGAIWANYACHCTTVGSRNRVGGDWAGYANEAMEKDFPEAVALMTVGCGADVGPQPSGNLDIARQHGQSIATEVRRLLAGRTTPLTGPPTVAARQVPLPLAKPKGKAHWEAQLQNSSGFDHQLAKAMLNRIETQGALKSTVDYPVSVWKFNRDLAMVFLGGEVVADYSVRLNRELDWRRLWITAWANAMPGYIPSHRVLKEGGYEADFSQVYYEQPGRYDPKIEDTLVQAITALTGKPFAAPRDQKPAPFNRLPNSDSATFQQLAARIKAPNLPEAEREIIDRIRQLLPQAQPAIGKYLKDDAQQTDWHNFAGDHVPRRFFRQQTKGHTLRWAMPPADDAKGQMVYVFLGGVGFINQPKTDGFKLTIDDLSPLTFDITREAAHWKSADGKVEMLYLPTWTSGLDSAGYFFLITPKPAKTVSITSLGTGSLRWFAVDIEQALSDRLRQLTRALTP